MTSILAQPTTKSINLSQSATSFNPQIALIPDPHRIITALNVFRGEGRTIATLDLKIGGLLIRRIRVVRGRGNITHINYPATKDAETGQWVHLVEFSSQELEATARAAILQAVGWAVN